ncbi:MAG: exodeoxyribonuclease I [Gammaproteobacteria bacterium]|nr:exodeoxyribonuclease I [Gammaproteobacteria bacterium]
MYWHDYETFGDNPKRDRPAQFAGVRTDEDLNIIGEPLVVYCKPGNDMLPQPQACLITGITPRIASEKGVSEAEFITRIHRELSRAGTCGVGYNSIRFDDEFTRYCLYRNFFDAYAREWRNGNSRWDIIDMLRITRALRPEGIEWPDHPDGTPSFKLEDLARANGILHEEAHEALSDVHASIGVAKLVKERQPRLYDYLYRLRNKREVGKLLNIREKKPVLHTSSMYPAESGCTTMVAPVALHPVNTNAIIVYDLRHDPAPFLSLSPEDMRERLFTPKKELAEGVERIPLKAVHINKCPVVAPVKTLDPASVTRLKIDRSSCEAHLEVLRNAGDFAAKIQQAFGSQAFEPEPDPEHNLYGGGFFSDADRAQMNAVRSCSPSELGKRKLKFKDARLPDLLFRYRARNYPETLSPAERARWEAYRMARLQSADGGASITLQDYFSTIDEMRKNKDCSQKNLAILDELEAYGTAITGHSFPIKN